MAVHTSPMLTTRAPHRARYIHDPNPSSFNHFNPVRYSDASSQNDHRERRQVSPVPPESQESRSTSTSTSTPIRQQTAPSTTQIIEACHLIDGEISTSPRTTLGEALNESAYISSEALISRWEVDLSILCERYLKGSFTPDVFAQKLEGIMPAVKQLENARDELRDVLDETTWRALDRRCAVLENAFVGLSRRLAEMDAES